MVSNERVIHIEPSGGSKGNVLLKIRELIRLYENTVENEEVAVITFKLKKPLR